MLMVRYFIGFLALTLLLTPAVFAQEPTPDATAEADLEVVVNGINVEDDLGEDLEAEVLPTTDRWAFWWENVTTRIDTAFTFQAERKAEKLQLRLHQLDRKAVACAELGDEECLTSIEERSTALQERTEAFIQRKEELRDQLLDKFTTWRERRQDHRQALQERIEERKNRRDELKTEWQERREEAQRRRHERLKERRTQRTEHVEQRREQREEHRDELQQQREGRQERSAPLPGHGEPIIQRQRTQTEAIKQRRVEQLKAADGEPVQNEINISSDDDSVRLNLKQRVEGSAEVRTSTSVHVSTDQDN